MPSCLPKAVALCVHGGVQDVQSARDLGIGERFVEQALRPQRANPVSAPRPDWASLQGEHVEKFLGPAGGEQAGEAEGRPPYDEATRRLVGPSPSQQRQNIVCPA